MVRSKLNPSLHLGDMRGLRGQAAGSKHVVSFCRSASYPRGAPIAKHALLISQILS